MKNDWKFSSDKEDMHLALRYLMRILCQDSILRRVKAINLFFSFEVTRNEKIEFSWTCCFHSFDWRIVSSSDPDASKIASNPQGCPSLSGAWRALILFEWDSSPPRVSLWDTNVTPFSTMLNVINGSPYHKAHCYLKQGIVALHVNVNFSTSQAT